MTVRRRMILQLTAMVDLLFIVMFLQYMELQDASARQVQSEAVRRRVAETAQADALRKQDDANNLKSIALARTGDLTRQLQLAQSRTAELEQELRDARQKIASTTLDKEAEEKKAYRQLKQVAEVVKDMTGVPVEAVTGALKGMPEAEQAKLRQKLEEIKTQPPAQLVQHLRESAEIRKYCEIWEVHILSTNEVQIKMKAKGDDADAPKFFIRDRSEFANRLVSAAKDAGEPKSLVIVCLTWGNADLRTRSEVQAGLKDAVTLLKPEWGGVKRIEMAKLGYTDEP